MRRPARTGLIGAVVLLSACLSSCQPVMAGARCSTASFGSSGRWVLACRNGRWTRVATVADVAALLARSRQVTTVPDGVTVSRIDVDNGSRHLVTTVFRPSGPGPWPLVVFAHGYNNTPAPYEPMLRSWAQNGLLVAAPESPGLARGRGPLDESNIANQPGDLSATVTAMLAGSSVIPGEIAAVGHSDGGVAVAGMALSSRYHDGRIVAHVVLSGSVGFVAPSDRISGSGPLLAVVGDADEFHNLGPTQRTYAAAPAPKGMIIIRGGRHLDPFIGGSAQSGTVRASVLDFLLGALTGSGWGRLRADVARDGLSFLSDGFLDPVPAPTDPGPPPAPISTPPESSTTTTTTSTTSTPGPIGG